MGIAGHHGRRLQILKSYVGASFRRRRSAALILLAPDSHMQLILYILRRLAITAGVVFIVLSFAGTLGISLRYLFDRNSYFEFFGDRDPSAERLWVVILHILPAIIALLIGPLQLSANIRKFVPRLHRITGRVYLCSVLASACGALAITPYSLGGTRNAMGFGLLAIVWTATTVKAVWRIRNGHISKHRFWMIMSYALTLAGVTLRVQLGVFTGLIGMSFSHAYSITAWSSWIPNLVIAGIWIRYGTRRQE